VPASGVTAVPDGTVATDPMDLGATHRGRERLPAPSRESPPVGWAFAAGGVTLIASLSVLGTGLATADVPKDAHGAIYAGQILGASAPLLAHAIAGDGTRGLLWSLGTSTTTLAMATLLNLHPSAPASASHDGAAFNVIVAVGFGLATLGVIDVLGTRSRLQTVDVAPLPSSKIDFVHGTLFSMKGALP
jgi:hypothetical protein